MVLRVGAAGAPRTPVALQLGRGWVPVSRPPAKALAGGLLGTVPSAFRNVELELLGSALWAEFAEWGPVLALGPDRGFTRFQRSGRSQAGAVFQDFFFYSLVYDPQQKTLLADKGEIRVGNRYQADITDLLREGEEDGRDQSKLETKVWEAHNPLVDKQIDQFLVAWPAHPHPGSPRASLPQGGPVLCRDEMEEWSASEASLFEEALEKYGKDFTDIQQDFLPWKSLTSIIEYYYMWKTTDRYVQQVGWGPRTDTCSGGLGDHGQTRTAGGLGDHGQTRTAEILRPWHAARHPCLPINSAAIKAECTARLPEASQSPLVLKQAVRKPLEAVLRYLGEPPLPSLSLPQLLLGARARVASPVLACALPGGVMDRAVGVVGVAGEGCQAQLEEGIKGCEAVSLGWGHLPWGASQLRKRLTRRRVESVCTCGFFQNGCFRAVCRACGPERWAGPAHLDLNSLTPAPALRPPRLPRARATLTLSVLFSPQPVPFVGTYLGLTNHGQTRHMGPSRNLLLNGKSYPTKVRLIRGGSLPPVKRRRMNWIDAPDDVFYMATEETRWGPMNLSSVPYTWNVRAGAAGGRAA
ncbi:PREDICTED: metastasis-associated protein MTA1 [Myotis brandtii]|uniref:metastasis-associated protein MTA1 n=1 Tax=Myotis brandtii TaxID=109478 RepID=UPI000703E36C|nr:PREDICTED: metastasis-associated protein MTA1 [Myotis brandtii]